MGRPLRKSPQIYQLAQDLGIKASGNIVSDLIKFCEKRIAKLMKDFPDCRTPSEVLGCVGAKLGTQFETIRTQADFTSTYEKYVALGERGFANLADELSDDVFGLTIKRSNQQLWEPEYVSVIDSRGNKRAREYFTKWHEVAHLLTMTDQRRLAFRRTHCPGEAKDPEESLMDLIAGNFGFRPPVGFEISTKEISFDAIENLRQDLCPESSKQAALLNFVKFWPVPCMLISAKMGLRRRDQAALAQQTFDFAALPIESLRAVHVKPSDLARETGFAIHRNMRVPELSVIHQVFADGSPYAEADEDLSWWESSDGNRLPQHAVRVKARRGWDSVEALVTSVQ